MRIRTVKPEFFLHEGLFDLERETKLPIRLSFVGLWCAADREGRFKWEPRKLKAQVLPYDDIDFSRVLDALTTRGFVVHYASDTCEFGCIPSFKRHQVVNNRERLSDLPSPSECVVRESLDACLTRGDACLTVLDPALVEGKGREGNGSTPLPPHGALLDLEPEPPKREQPNWTPIQVRLNAIFKRRPTTVWTRSEQRAFKALGEISDEDLRLIETYYSAKIPDGKDYRRHDLCTLLNNFSGEVDRARNFKPPTVKCF